MIKVSNITLPIGYSDSDLQKQVAGLLRVKKSEVKDIKILKKSKDCRNKASLKYVLCVGVLLLDEKKYCEKNTTKERIDETPKNIENHLKNSGIDGGFIKKTKDKTIVIVGSGPAGLFAALTLAKAGFYPIIFERGTSVEERKSSVDLFNKVGVLDLDSNIQFGEGGAGTFSDGKLNTGVGGDLVEVVLETLKEFGGGEEITYLAKPHIGTDKLVNVVKNMREEIKSLGGKFYFRTRVAEILEKNNVLWGVETQGAYNCVTQADAVILATGHSARDTYTMLLEKGVKLVQKPFAVGLRIEHRQEQINLSQYGVKDDGGIGAADYKVAGHFGERSCFSFCMCPGGFVVAGASEEGGVVTNGMSHQARDGVNANSALLVNVTPKDFNNESPLAGIGFQRKYERLAFSLGGGGFRSPVQKVGDFLSGRVSSSFGEVLPTYPRGTAFADLRECLPKFVIETIKQGIKEFDKKIKSFAHPDALLVGVETRSSAPIRVVRDDNYEASIKGLYPCGEGAGYAGGITSAAIDGINVAIAAIKKLVNG